MNSAGKPADQMQFKIVGRSVDATQSVQCAIDQILDGVDSPRVLEAGCGSTSRVRLPVSTHLAGIDIAQRQLDNNTALNEKILGDVQTHIWTQNSFDLIVSWDVLEHLNNPGAALERLVESLKAGGAIVLAFPNIWSLKGIVTKLTPFWVHTLFYRHIVGDKRSDDEWDQFPTYLRIAMAPGAIRKWARSKGLIVACEAVYEGPVQTVARRSG